MADDQNWIPETPSSPKPLQGNGEARRFVESDQVDETTRKRKKMKRHRPKVLLDNDKPKRTPKPKHVTTPNPRTPKPRTPKPANEKNTERRKYVRKCNLAGLAANDISDVEEHIDDDVDVDGASANRTKGYGHAQQSCIQRMSTCKKKLDFNVEHYDDFGIVDEPGSFFEDSGTGKIDAKVPNTLITYQRRFFLNNCLKNSRRLAPVFPTVFKRTRKKQPKRTNFTNFAGLAMVDLLSSVRRRTRSKTSVRYRRKDFSSLLIQKCTDAYRQVQDKSNPEFTEEDQVEEQDLATNKVDAVSHRRNINNSCANHSLELIPRKFPPNLERNYFLTSRDDTGFLEALINSIIMRLASLCVYDKNEGKCPTKPKLKKSATATTSTGKIPMKPKKPKILIDFDKETLEGWILMKNGTWDWNSIFCLEDGRGSGNNMLVNYIEDNSKSMEWNNIMRYGSGNNGGVETDNMKYWTEEIDEFSEQIKKFICSMSEYLGDRSFSKMKGSVLDSIVGVFLTQNVGDKLSSSAFLSLAAKYPPRSTGTNSRSESTGRDARRPGQLANIITDQHLLTWHQDQILENGSGTCTLTRDEIISSSTGDGLREKDSYDQILEGGSQTCVHTTNKMAAGLSEDEMIDLDETTFVKCQESVIQGDHSSSSFNDMVGVEASNGDNTCFQSSVKTNNDDNVSSQSSIESNKTKNGEKASSQSSVEFNNGHTDSSSGSKRKKGKVNHKRDIKIDWDELRRTYKFDDDGEADNVDWEAVRQARVEDIAETIVGRGMSNRLAKRIKDFLDRVVEEHGSIDLEWLRRVPPDKVKDYLLSYKGLGLKSVECVRLLGLQMVAFPVDVNVARILVRLGWVPLQPLSDNIPFHLLNSYPDISDVQKYVWPRLCSQSMWILYMFHCYLITCGKVFCTKINEKCDACPMKPDCKHYKSKTASSKLRLPGPAKSSEPIIEHPPSPEPARGEIQDIEDFGGTSKNEKILVALDSCKSRIDLSLATTSIPMPKLLMYKDRLKTVHLVFVLPDSHPLLAGFDELVPGERYPYILAVWTEGVDAAASSQQSNECDCSTLTTSLAASVAGTILVPYMTATRGAFPLNATYFQPNEYFADHETSRNPIRFSTHLLSGLSTRILHCGANVKSISSDSSADQIRQQFWGDVICNRGFDRATKKPEPLSRKFHVSKSKKNQED